VVVDPCVVVLCLALLLIPRSLHPLAGVDSKTLVNVMSTPALDQLVSRAARLDADTPPMRGGASGSAASLQLDDDALGMDINSTEDQGHTSFFSDFAVATTKNWGSDDDEDEVNDQSNSTAQTSSRALTRGAATPSLSITPTLLGRR
jgi:hypothetical protein